MRPDDVNFLAMVDAKMSLRSIGGLYGRSAAWAERRLTALRPPKPLVVTPPPPRSRVGPAEAHRRRYGCDAHQIEPGRGVPNNWDRALFEPWAQRKARRAAERAGAGA